MQTCVSYACLLDCPGCPLKTPANRPALPHSETSPWFPMAKRWFFHHIVGGEPLLANPTEWLALTQGHRVHLWTTGIGKPYLDPLLPYIHRITVFVPAYGQAEYLDHTGYDGWDQLNTTIQWIQDAQIPLRITTLVRPSTIQTLPDFYTWTQDIAKAPFILQYIPTDAWSSPLSIEYIQHMRKKKNCRVIRKKPGSGYCLGVIQ
ncbi:MAG: hypothetical protein O3A77_01095 [bacterium]|nr:hypothetical protein [bacterium]